NSTTIDNNTSNLIEDNTCSPAFSGDPNLGPLQDNGGNGHTHALLSGSLAIDAGDDDSAEDVDQRNINRPVDGNGDHFTTADIGAYEYRLGTVEFDSAVYSTSENDEIIIITVHRSDSCDGTTSVSYTSSDETAVSPSDYAFAGGTLNWSRNDSAEKSFAIAIIDDAMDEDSETFNLTLSNPIGAQIGNQATAMVEINDNDHILTVVIEGSGTGSVVSSPAGIECGNTCSAVFSEETMVTLSAIAEDNDSIFAGWSGNVCSGSDNCTISLDAATGVTAKFTSITTDPDVDNDGIPTEWEVAHGLDSLVDDADEDPDGDGLSNYQEYLKDSDPFSETQGPGVAVLISPEDQQTNLSILPTLKSGYDSGAVKGQHSATFWQIATDEDFVYKVLQITSSKFKTRLPVPNGTLDEDMTYYWRVCYLDTDGATWAWSETRSFTTLTQAYTDDDNDGVPDDEEVTDDDIDLDADGNADKDQLDMKVIQVPGNAGSMGIKAGEHAAGIEFLSNVDTEEITETENKPVKFPRGFYNFRLVVDEPGATATATIYFSTPLPRRVGWHKYDRVNGWENYGDHVVISEDLRSVTLTFVDGGFGDADGVANGMIVDPSGPAFSGDFLWETSGCFLDTLYMTQMIKTGVILIVTWILCIFCLVRLRK
ncbi:MAG: choice-of-anchor Q domain-containing protein, partial [Desulfobacteraceae bacterium]